ncbi:ferritin-like domain-containing protein [Prosthecobacter sp.]|uniref:ferritin-like domain-containing protein n=1 Tax=Prosthecobacter sp. TaxID=1965333 RepID=UPI003782DB92
MKSNPLEDLFHQELRSLYSAEKQLLKAWMKMSQEARHPKLRAVFQTRLRETEGQIRRLEEMASLLGKSIHSARCVGMEQMIREGESLKVADAGDAGWDASLVAAAQHLQDYEIERCCVALALACRVGQHEIEVLLEKNLKEEKAAAVRLGKVAKTLKYREPAVRERARSRREEEMCVSFPESLLWAGAF